MNRGDLIGCTVKFDMESNGKVPVVFFLNGAQVTDEELLIEYEKTNKDIYPYVGMGQQGVQLLAKVRIFANDPSHRDFSGPIYHESLELLFNRDFSITRLKQVYSYSFAKPN